MQLAFGRAPILLPQVPLALENELLPAAVGPLPQEHWLRVPQHMWELIWI